MSVEVVRRYGATMFADRSSMEQAAVDVRQIVRRELHEKIEDDLSVDRVAFDVVFAHWQSADFREHEEFADIDGGWSLGSGSIRFSLSVPVALTEYDVTEQLDRIVPWVARRADVKFGAAQDRLKRGF